MTNCRACIRQAPAIPPEGTTIVPRETIINEDYQTIYNICCTFQIKVVPLYQKRWESPSKQTEAKQTITDYASRQEDYRL